MPSRADSRCAAPGVPGTSLVQFLGAVALALVLAFATGARAHAQGSASPGEVHDGHATPFDEAIRAHARQMIAQGRQTFRFDTFGDEAFWGGKLRLHEAIEGEHLGGVGPGLSPSAALDLGLKVDVDALPAPIVKALRQRRVDFSDPAVTVQLLESNAVVGLVGFFNGGRLDAVGITCALCHSTVDDSLASGIGHRLDGWANRDLDVGTIVSLAPDLSVVTSLLGVDRR